MNVWATADGTSRIAKIRTRTSVTNDAHSEDLKKFGSRAASLGIVKPSQDEAKQAAQRLLTEFSLTDSVANRVREPDATHNYLCL